MAVWIVLGLVLISILFLGLTRVKLPRQTGFEGIESPEVVQAYDRISRWPQFKVLRHIIVRELKKYHPKGMLVDVGCGPGYLVAVIARAFPDLRITGSDISEEMTAKATRNLAALGFVDRVEFRQGDVQKLPFADSSVDFVISTLSLHHWSGPPRAFREIYRVLKPGGQFLVFDLRRDCRRFFYGLVWFAQTFVVPEAMRATNEPINSVLSSYTPDELAAFVATLPLKQWRVKPGWGWMFLWGQKAV
jgi:ubiquinone/menaquinone biosynthesis C-methylase UbiE